MKPAADARIEELRAAAKASTRRLALPKRDVLEVRRGVRKKSLGPGGRGVLRIQLVERDGVLRWVELASTGRPTGRKRGLRKRGVAERGTEIHTIEFERIPPSEITKHLDGLDDQLTPARGLRRWAGGKLVPLRRGEEVAANAGQAVLLIIHGTFSKGEAITEQLAGAPGGAQLFADFGKKYAQILTFDHPTLAVSPMLNAFDLERALGACPATFDVIAHSRGGLVARCWADGFRGGRRGIGKLVMVGSPLAGTSLAAPPRLKAAMNYLSNVGGALRGFFGLGGFNPFLAIGAGLMQLFSSLTAIAAHTPILDAAVAMVPGLAAQSRVGNAPELLRLRDSNVIPAASFHSVRCNFEPPAVGWKFWELFKNPKGRLADLGADLLFPGDNDLVVDYDSIVSLSDATEVPAANRLELGTGDQVHHCNYFAQGKTVDALREWLLRK